jgi:hypothetical protein
MALIRVMPIFVRLGVDDMLNFLRFSGIFGRKNGVFSQKPLWDQFFA